MRNWMAAALMLAATTGWAQTGRVGPPKSEFKDGPFFVSWRYVTPSSGMVYATPKLKSKEPPQFTAGEPFELSITLRLPPETENPCALRPDTDGPCSMQATMVVQGTSPGDIATQYWQESVVLRDGLHTFHLRGTIAEDTRASRGYIDFRVLKGTQNILDFNGFPFRIRRP